MSTAHRIMAATSSVERGNIPLALQLSQCETRGIVNRMEQSIPIVSTRKPIAV